MSLLTRTDVTAVKFYSNLILAGIGSSIHVFDKSTTKLLQRLIALNGQKIYGFVPSKCDANVLVFGGKQFTVVSRTTRKEVDVHNKVLRRKFEAVVCDDWIHSAVWIDNAVVVLLTAHNVVQMWDTVTRKLLCCNASKDNSILYSGLLLPLKDDVLVMAGTVFSEVIIHKCGDEKRLHNLKGHKGVIFSITCNPEQNIIVTTSDDRSIRIWGPDIIPTHPHCTLDYWLDINIVCKHEVYGHLARVMRSCITNDLIISVGEDSAICYWDHDGKLLKKVITHQNASIWTVDSDGEYLVTGGGDCGVILHPLSVAKHYSQNEVIDISVATPKKVEFTARRNIVVIDEDNFIYYDLINKDTEIYGLKHESTYKLLSLSSCKQLIAVTDMTGKLDIFVENCKGDCTITKIIDIKLNIGKVLSMHWAGNRHLIFCTEDGNITVYSSSDTIIEKHANFKLPPCKEALLTAAAIDCKKKYFAVGDRCGNIHVFVKGQTNPIKSFNKVHGRYGPRSITFKNNNIVTTGRDHSVKYFIIYEGSIKLMSSKDLPFAWVEKFLDKDLNLVCGFQERVFVVHNVKDNSKLIEIPCGGGHRSFDAIKYIDKVNDKYEEIVKLVYLKDADLNVATFQLEKIASKNIINGSHAKEINCLKTHKVSNTTIFISGGEDTTLRISAMDAALNFRDEVCFKHLSSVRTLCTQFIDTNSFLLISAGGRAQISVKKVKIEGESKLEFVSEELVDYLVKGTDKERRGNHSWKSCDVDFDPEMRIMDTDVLLNRDDFIIFAGCSDAYLRTFSFKDKNTRLELINASKYHATCILQIKIIKVLNRNVLITCSTRGEVAFWDVTDVTKAELKPYFITKTNKSGINSLFFSTISDNEIVVGTGGDDNTIHLILLQIPDRNDLSSTKVLNFWNSSNCHSSQITGLCAVDSYIMSTSVDQRVTLLRWEIIESRIECMFVTQTYTNVADVHGIELLENSSNSISVCVFGKGIEVISVPKIN